MVQGKFGIEAFRWTLEGGMAGLGVLSGNDQSYATGVSSDGTVIVGESSGGGSRTNPSDGRKRLEW